MVSTDIDTTVSAIAARKRGVTFAAAEDAPKVNPSLTPVGTERAPAPLAGAHKVNFPYDDPQTVQQALRDALKALADIQQHLGHVGKGVIALSQLYGLDGASPSGPALVLDEAVALEHSLMDIERKRLAADEALVGATGPSARPRERDAATAAKRRLAAAPAGEEAFTDRLTRLASTWRTSGSRLSAEARAHAFKGNFVPAAKEVFGDMLLDAVAADADASWLCPTHGRGKLVTLTSRKGRKYLACEICKQFEKEVQP